MVNIVLKLILLLKLIKQDRFRGLHCLTELVIASRILWDVHSDDHNLATVTHQVTDLQDLELSCAESDCIITVELSGIRVHQDNFSRANEDADLG